MKNATLASAVIAFSALSLLAGRHFEQSDTAALKGASVKLLRLPNGGIQPQAVTDAKGVAHLVYFTGDAGHGDLSYVRSADGGQTFSAPIRVNSEPDSAVAAGNIRGARIALGTNDQIHVAWNGSTRTNDEKAAMLYSRLNAAGGSFEPERNLIRNAWGIDGGGAVAADRSGNVYVFWHAPLPGGKDEAARRVWVARSQDDGKTFQPEQIAFTSPTGVCGCCGMNAYSDSLGNVYALFRSATQMVNRDMYLLSSRDHGHSFRGTDVSKWNVGYCVMSSEAFAENNRRLRAAWETEKQIFYASIDVKTGNMLPADHAPGTGPNRKYPALAVNRQGQTLLAWTEGMGWKKGGSVAWQVFDDAGRPIGKTGHAPGVPAWGLVAAFTAPDDTFRIIF